MSTETMKNRTEAQLIKMGCSSDQAKDLITKLWEQVSYLKTAREKANYMIA